MTNTFLQINYGDVYTTQVVSGFKAVLKIFSNFNLFDQPGIPNFLTEAQSYYKVYYFILSYFDVPWDALQLVYLCINLLIAIFSFYFLFKKLLGQNATVCLWLAFASVFNPVTAILYNSDVIINALAFDPLLVLIAIRFNDRKSPFKDAILLSAATAFIVPQIANPPFYILSIGFPVVIFSYKAFHEYGKQSALFILVFFVVFCVANSFWLYDFYLYLNDLEYNSRFKEVGSSWAWTSSDSSPLNVLSFTGQWSMHEAAIRYKDQYSMYYTFSGFYKPLYLKAIVVILLYTPIVLSYRKIMSNPVHKVLFMCGTVFCVLSIGNYKLFTHIYTLLTHILPIFALYREPWVKFMPFYVPIALSLFVLYSKKYYVNRYLLFAIYFVISVYLFYPFITLKVIPDSSRGIMPSAFNKVPNYLIDASFFVNNTVNPNALFYALPFYPSKHYQQHYFFPNDGYYGVEPYSKILGVPLFGQTSGYIKNREILDIHQHVDEIRNRPKTADELYNFLAKLGVNYLILRNDLDTKFFESIDDRYNNHEYYKKLIKADHRFKVVFEAYSTESHMLTDEFYKGIPLGVTIYKLDAPPVSERYYNLGLKDIGVNFVLNGQENYIFNSLIPATNNLTLRPSKNNVISFNKDKKIVVNCYQTPTDGCDSYSVKFDYGNGFFKLFLVAAHFFSLFLAICMLIPFAFFII